MAQFNLSVLYVLGVGVPEDYVKGYAWTILAAAQGHERAIEAKELLRKKMTAEQVAEAQKRASRLWERIESLKSD